VISALLRGRLGDRKTSNYQQIGRRYGRRATGYLRVAKEEISTIKGGAIRVWAWPTARAR
jgi:hypothetical protein